MNKENRTNSKGHTMQYILLLAILFCGHLAQAQVTIGERKKPEQYSVLELSTANHKRGLRLPPLTTPEITTLASLITGSPTLAKGLVIYNTTKDSLQYWNNTKWVNIKGEQAPAVITFNPKTISVSAATTASQNVTAASASCTTPSSYTYGIISGSTYCTVSSPGTSAFYVQFTANTTGKTRTALISVKDPCGNSTNFIATQQP